MIENKKVAEEISALMFDVTARLNGSIAHVQDTCSDKEFKAYRLACAKILGEVLVDVLNPLYAAHPDLKPDSFD
jgi:hypothetical protein